MTAIVLQFEGLRKSFGSTAVLQGIDAEARTGDIIGLIGLNGAGKTTLLETALGFSPPSAGAARVLGQDSLTLDQRVKARIGFVPQRDELLDNVTGRRYLDLIGECYHRWNRELIERLSREWTVPMDAAIRTLSLGQRQKLSILSALGHEPDLIVLDEPVASLDPMARRLFLKELIEIASAHPCTIIFSTHIVGDLERVASRVWMLKDGRIVIDEDLDGLKERCARVHLPPGAAVPQAFHDAELIHQRREQNTQVLTFGDWSAELQRQLEQAAGVALTPEWLSLEDIFLEVHA